MTSAHSELIPQLLAARRGLRNALFACVSSLSCLGFVRAAEVDLTPVSSADGLYSLVNVGGETAWQNIPPDSSYLYARRPDSFSFTPGQTLYVRVTYFDQADGNLFLEYDSQTQPYTGSPIRTRTTGVGTNQFVNGYFELPNVLFNKRQNANTDFRIVCLGRIPVQRITLSDTPFDDPDFQLAIARAWQNRYTGPAKDYVDRTTLKGKAMTGYQGWFRTPNDLTGGSWSHWIRGSSMTSENFAIDAWPDLKDYDPASLVRAGNVMTASGQPAYLFSSSNYAAVRHHFRTMRKHNVDGAWVQRFHPQAGGETEWPLLNVSRAAAEEGLVWGVEYDVSGMADATVAAKLQADWEWLTTEFDILNDPRYIHEDGKPVVFIWGLTVPDRNFTPANSNAVVDYFKAQGVHVLGGLASNWASLNASWQTHIAKYDGVLVWMNQNTSDATFFRNRGQDFYPHIWPGFSWAHLKQLPATPLVQFTDRTGGQFYWTKGRTWINAGATDSLFFGMWDEFDEATQLIPMTDDPPLPHTTWGRFINNQNKPPDWWMMLGDELKRMMFDQRADTNTLPAIASLVNRSNIGAEASVDLGATDLTASLSRVNNPGDGGTIVETVGGRESRGNALPTSTHRYMYFDVDNAFAHQLVNGDVTIEVEYYDNDLSSTLGLQYDSTSAAYTTHPQVITTTGSNTWRRVRFEIADAFFGGRQNDAADFRLDFNGTKLNVNRVWVRLPEGKVYPFTWNNATSGPALNWSNGANWLGGIVGQSDLTSTVRILPGKTLPGGIIPISNDLTDLQLATLNLGGSASTSGNTTVTLSGNTFSLGGAAPSLTLDATKTAFDLTYDIAASVTLLGTTQVNGTGNASLLISGPLSGSGGLNKTNPGTLVLTGTNTNAGATQIQSGTLLVNAPGSLASASVVSIAGAAALGGDGAINGPVTVAASGSLVPGGVGTIGTLTLANNSASSLTLNGSSLNFDLPDSGTTGDRINLTGASGALVLNGANFITLNAISGTVPPGVYILMTFASKTGAGTLTFPNGLATFANATLAVGSTNVTLTVGPGGLGQLVTWRGTVSGVWDGGVLNWNRDGLNSQAYMPGDSVTFDDTGSTAATISSSAAVAPAAVLFNNSVSQPYTVSAVITGTTTLEKNGTGITTLTGANAYTGGTTVNGGRLTFQNSTAGSHNYIAANIGATLEFNVTSGDRQLSGGSITGGGTFVKSGAGQFWLGTNGAPQTVALGSGSLIDVQGGLMRNEYGSSGWGGNLADVNVASGAFLDLWDGSITVDAITGSGTINQAWSGTHTLTFGVDNGSGTFSGTISSLGTPSGGGYSGEGGGTLNLVKQGTGTQTLSGSNNHSGSTTVSGGTLRLSGSSSLNNGNYAGAIILSNSANFEKLSNGTQTLSGAITGSGSVKLDNADGQLLLQNATNSYSALGIGAGRVFIQSSGALPATAAVNLTGGTLDFDTGGTYNSAITVSSGANLAARGATTLSDVTLSSPGTFIFNNDDAPTAALQISSNQTLTGSLTVQIGGSRMQPAGGVLGVVTLSGVITGSGSLVMSSSGNVSNPNFGTGVLALSGANDYTGDTTVNSGTLAVNGTALPDGTKLTIAGGKVALTNAERVANLFFGAVQQAPGIWGSSASTAVAPFIDNTRFNGTGTLVVGPASAYASWQAANGTTQTANLDHDNDGVSNGVEHFLGGIGNTTGNSNPLPGVIDHAGTLSITWVRHPDFPGFPNNYGTAFVVETSATLAAPWTPAVIGAGAGKVEIIGNNVKYTLPAGSKNFARLKVVAPSP